MQAGKFQEAHIYLHFGIKIINLKNVNKSILFLNEISRFVAGRQRIIFKSDRMIQMIPIDINNLV